MKICSGLLRRRLIDTDMLSLRELTLLVLLLWTIVGILVSALFGWLP